MTYESFMIQVERASSHVPLPMSVFGKLQYALLPSAPFRGYASCCTQSTDTHERLQAIGMYECVDLG